MTAPLDRPDWMLDILTMSPVADLARLHPERTYVHTIPFEMLRAEEHEITHALSLGDYRKADWVKPLPTAVDTLIDDLHDIAIEREIDGYPVGCNISANGDLEVTMVFASVVDMAHFKLALP
ncbi:hypothetical protein [Microvirga massiliensis]|uniref:hypothetical protein n=1 Tax=Microvirga massiliensis TaxID=1033741 RepID=UPI00062B7135|nr:hypothetical protein [Microvirga massiliensis]